MIRALMRLYAYLSSHSARAGADKVAVQQAV